MLSSSETVCLNEYRIIIDAPISHVFSAHGVDDRYPREPILSVCEKILLLLLTQAVDRRLSR